MSSVVSIRFRETIPLNIAQIGEIYQSIGPVRAEDLICRSLARLSFLFVRLDGINLWQDGDVVVETLSDIVSEAMGIGLVALAEIALDVLDCHETGDVIASAATLARLVRAGEPLRGMDLLDHTMPH